MNNSRTKRIITRYEIVVDVGQVGRNWLDDWVKDLNDLFRAHKDFDSYKAYIEEWFEDDCVLCNQKYESSYDKEGKEFCSNCGAGDKEYMLHKLEEAK